MISSVLPETNLWEIPKDAVQLHFVRPIKKRLLRGIIKKCGILEEVTMSKSCRQRMPKESLKMLEEGKIAIVEKARQGRPLSIPLEKMQHALEMRKDFQSLREVEHITGISKSTVHYLEKYAKRGKIKNGKRVVYLK